MSETPLTCPRCQTTLRQHAFGAVVVDGCDTCGGLWFDTDELAQLAKGGQETVVAAETVFAPPEPVADTVASKGLCPRCQVALYPFQFEHTPEVTLDACSSCRGIWMDDQELAAIGRRLAPAQPQAAPAQPQTVRQKARQAQCFLRRVPCGKCGEENPEGAVTCWACGAAMGRRKTGKLCPRCDGRLDYISAEDLQIVPPPHVDHCPDCGGIWIERTCLSPLMDVDLQDLTRWEEHLATHVRGALETREAEILCPVCQLLLDEHPYAREQHVRIDQCGCCRGTWLDGGELALIKRISVEQDVWGRPNDL